MGRTLCFETTKKLGKKVQLSGWVDSVRDHGKLIFIDLRDRSGIVQLVTGLPDGTRLSRRNNVKNIRPEFVIEVEGKVKKRQKGTQNLDLPTGKVEVAVEKISVLTEAATLPFSISGDGLDINEVIRSKYRYLDLRRERMQKNLKLRHKVVKFIRAYLDKKDFIEIETPILTKSTPEGARDFIVPSRKQHGKFYALPQSPQQYKQLLMVAGFENYYQIARCFRDEDPRADRAYGEFTQLDVEMSFVTQDDILKLVENLFTTLVKRLFPEKKITKSPWPRIPQPEALKKYKSDKPDLRKNEKDPDELSFAWIIDFPLFVKQSEEDFFYGSGESKFAPSHHMFTSPHPEDIKLLDSDPLKVRGLQHDMVLNGFEIGGGSIRIHEAPIQEKIFELIGFTNEQKKEFSHMLEAFEYGVPPHGGIAPGIDRFLYAALREKSLREVIAFPTSSSGQTSVMDAPSEVSGEQLAELGVSVIKLTLFEKIKKVLDSEKIEYKLFEHVPVYTSNEAAKIRGTDIASGAKALVFSADKNPIMIVVPGDKKVDMKKFKKEFDIKNLKMMEKDEASKLTGVEVGAISPFGNLMGLPTYFDKKLSEKALVVFNAGAHDKSIEMKGPDLVKLVGPKVGSFAAS